MYVLAGFCGTFLSAIFFWICKKTVASYLDSSTNPDLQTWKIKNLSVSWINAILVGIWTLYCIIMYPDLRNNTLEFIDPVSYALVAFALGYFVYDFLDIVINDSWRRNWEVTFHHIGVMAVFLFNIIACQCIGYTVYALLTEVNSIFLHFRKLMQLTKVSPQSAIYRINAVANVVSCAVFRGVALAVILYAMAVESLIEKCGVLYFLMLSLVMVMMVIINPVLLWKLIKSDFLRQTKGRQKRVDGAQHTTNNNQQTSNNHRREKGSKTV